MPSAGQGCRDTISQTLLAGVENGTAALVAASLKTKHAIPIQPSSHIPGHFTLVN